MSAAQPASSVAADLMGRVHDAGRAVGESTRGGCVLHGPDGEAETVGDDNVVRLGQLGGLGLMSRASLDRPPIFPTYETKQSRRPLRYYVPPRVCTWRLKKTRWERERDVVCVTRFVTPLRGRMSGVWTGACWHLITGKRW